MRISKAETRLLVKEFKKLVERDIVGITVSDARNTVRQWLETVGQLDAAQDFANEVYKYQTSDKIAKREDEYNEQY